MMNSVLKMMNLVLQMTKGAGDSSDEDEVRTSGEDEVRTPATIQVPKKR